MKIAAIIAEYNPFHKGHAYQAQKTRMAGATHIAAIMSGSFVQRGEVASFDKWSRAEAALKNGIDLVVELPVEYSLSAANRFAGAGVFMANRLGASVLSFGSESGNIEQLSAIAAAAKATAANPIMRPLLLKGLSYPRALHEAVHTLYGESVSAMLKTPNNLLAIEYINAINERGYAIEPFTIKRVGEHDGLYPQKNIASASYLRELSAEAKDILRVRPFVPQSAYCVYEKAFESGKSPISAKGLELAILYRLRSMRESDFAILPDVCEGLENRLYEKAKAACSLEEFLFLAKTKRYTMARLRRIVYAAFLGMTVADTLIAPQYVHVLGANKRGMEILGACKMQQSEADIPLSTKLAALSRLGEKSPKLLRSIELNARATDFAMLGAPAISPCGLDFIRKTIILE